MDVISFQKIFGLCGLKCHIVEILELSLFTNVISLKILSSPKSGFISGTEIMIYHLKRKGMEVGVWDGNNLIV